MSKQKQCVDFYGERLNVGDEVIPMIEEALLIGIGGVVSDIVYSEKYDHYYITISDKEGNILLETVDARCYTTRERYDERENQKYVYSLKFYNKRFWPLTSIPLTNKTNPEYEIPEETCFVSLDAEHLKKKGYQLTEKSWQCSEYSLCKICYFAVDEYVKLCHEEANDFRYLLNPNTNDWYPIYNDCILFSNVEELKERVKSIIEYFSKADLTNVNNDSEFDKNEQGKEFERKLILQVKH